MGMYDNCGMTNMQCPKMNQVGKQKVPVLDW